MLNSVNPIAVTDNVPSQLMNPPSGSRTIPIYEKFPPTVPIIPTIVPLKTATVRAFSSSVDGKGFPPTIVKNTPIYTDPTLDVKGLFLRDFHGRTYIRRFLTSLLLLIVTSWIFAEYGDTRTITGLSLLRTDVLVLFILNITFFTFQLVIEIWLIITGCVRYRRMLNNSLTSTSSMVSTNGSTGNKYPVSTSTPFLRPVPTPIETNNTSTTSTSNNETENGNTITIPPTNILPSSSSSSSSLFHRSTTASSKRLRNLCVQRYMNCQRMYIAGFPLLDLHPYWFISKGYLDKLWLFQIIFATIVQQVSLITLCTDPVRSLALRQCQTWKLSLIPVSPFLVCWCASSLILLLSTLSLYNFIATMIVFGLTTGLWITLYNPVPEPLTVFNPSLSVITTIYPEGSQFNTIQSSSNAFAIVLFIATWILMSVLAVIVPRIYRMNYSLRLLHQEQLFLYKESTVKKEKAARKAVYARILAIRATTASIVADATIGYTFHALKNPLHVLTVLMDEWTETYYKSFFTASATTTTGSAVEPPTTTILVPSLLSISTVNKYIPISIEDLEMFAEALARLQRTTEAAGIHNSLLGRRIKYNPETIYLTEYLSLMIQESLSQWEQELYIGHHHRFVTAITVPLYTIPFYRIDPRIYTYVTLDRLRIRDVLRNAFSNAYEASFELLHFFLPDVKRESLKYDTETNRQRYLRQQSIHFFIRSLQNYPEFMEQLVTNNLAPYPVSLQVSLVSRPYLHANEIFASPTAVIADGNRGKYYTSHPLPYPLPENYFTTPSNIPTNNIPPMPLNTANPVLFPSVVPSVEPANVSDAEKGQIINDNNRAKTNVSHENDASTEPKDAGTPENATPEIITPSTGLISIFSPDKDTYSRAIRTVYPFLRFEIINIGYGLPTGETARSLFAPFLAVHSRSSDLSTEEIRETVSDAPKPSLSPTVNPTLPQRPTNETFPLSFNPTVQSLLPVPVASAAETTAQLLTPPTPSSDSNRLEIPRAEEQQINEICSMLQREDIKDNEPKDEERDTSMVTVEASSILPSHEVAGGPSSVPITGSSNASPPMNSPVSRTSTTSSLPPLHDEDAEEGNRHGTAHDEKERRKSSSNNGGGLYSHTRNTGLGLPIIRLTAELLHGYCGIYDDPTIELSIPIPLQSSETGNISSSSSSSAIPPSDINSSTNAPQLSLPVPRLLKVTRFFFEIPYVKGPGVVFPSVPLISTTHSDSGSSGFSLSPGIKPPETVSKNSVPALVVSVPVETTEKAPHPDLSAVESSPTAVLSYLRAPIMTPTSEVSVDKSYLESLVAATIPQRTVPVLSTRPSSSYAETIHENISSQPTVSLPPSVPYPLLQPRTPLPLVPSFTFSSQPLQNIRVLVVDDEEVVRRVSSRLLTKLGARVTTLTDGDEVLDAIVQADTEQDSYDAVLLDVIMRRMNGDAAVGQIRNAGFLSLPIFAASGNVTIEDTEKYIEHGFTAVLSKPYTKDNVLTLFVEYRIIGVPSEAATTMTITTPTTTVITRPTGTTSSLPSTHDESNQTTNREE